MVLKNKTIVVDTKDMHLWHLKHPHESFSEWVRNCVRLDVLPSEAVPTNHFTLDDVPTVPGPPTNPMDMEDRDEAEARARELFEGFKQGKQKTEAQLKQFMARWDEQHTKEA